MKCTALPPIGRDDFAVGVHLNLTTKYAQFVTQCQNWTLTAKVEADGKRYWSMVNAQGYEVVGDDEPFCSAVGHFLDDLMNFEGADFNGAGAVVA